MEYIWALLFVLALAAGWLLTVFTLPGTWLMVAAAVVYAAFMPQDLRVSIGWPTVAAMGVLAVVGELLETGAGALGAARGGGSKRAAVLAIVCSVPGAIIGALVGLPIPVVGPIIAVIVFAGLGALGGAMLGEAWKGRTLGESWKVGHAAFWGRVLGSLAKVVIASIMAALGLAALVWL